MIDQAMVVQILNLNPKTASLPELHCDVQTYIHINLTMNLSTNVVATQTRETREALRFGLCLRRFNITGLQLVRSL